MKIHTIFEEKRPVLSFEIFPPKKDTELKNIDETLEVLSDLHPDYISVTFGAGGSANQNRTIELARKIKEKYHIEPLIHLTSLHYDRAEIDAFTRELKKYDMENILALRGDRTPKMKEKKEFPNAADLIYHLQRKEEFCIAAACYPESHPESKSKVCDMQNLKVKVDEGVDFLITQMFFENELYYSFVENCRMIGIDIPITAGIMPVIHKKQVEKMVSLCGASLPERFEKILYRFGENKEALFDAGMSYATSQIIDLLVHDVEGIHLYTMNNPVVAKHIHSSIKNLVKSK